VSQSEFAGRDKSDSPTSANVAYATAMVELTGARGRWRERLDLLREVPSHRACPQHLGTE